MPQAIERSVATPMIKARLPVRNPMRCLRLRIMPQSDAAERCPGSAVARVQVDAQLLAGVDACMAAQAIPCEQLRHTALKEVRDLRHRVAFANGIDDFTVRHVARGAALRQADALT